MSGETRANLTWLLPDSITEWQRELDTLCALRLMLAGLALRHAADPDTGRVNLGLNSDIATAQAVLQDSIDRVSETLAALRELARAIEGKPPLASGKETLH